MKQFVATIASCISTAAIVSAVVSISTSAAQTDQPVVGGFEGEAVLERLDDDPFVPRFRLIGELRFKRAGGQVWSTPANTILEGRSVPTVFVQLKGHPFESEFPKTAITYDYAVESKQRTWEEAKQMFYEAAVTEGIDPVEAKAMYMLLRASGTRWAMHGPNSCFSRCHVSEEELEWRPRVDHEKLVALLEWVRSESPTLDAVDQRASEAIIEKGPHIFGNLE